MLNDNQKAVFRNSKIEITVFEYVLLKFREPGRPIYINETVVRKLIFSLGDANFNSEFVCFNKVNEPITRIDQLNFNDSEHVYQLWLVADYKANSLSKNDRLEEQAKAIETQRLQSETLAKELHTRLIKVRSALIQKGAKQEDINRLIQMALKPHSILGKGVVSSGTIELSAEEKAKVAKGYELRKKFGIAEILAKMGE